MRYSSALLLAGSAVAQEACSPLHFIYARATTEQPQKITSTTSVAEFERLANNDKNKGYGAAGHSIFTNMTMLIPAASGWPVHYPAAFDLGSQCNSENPGVLDILNQIRTKSKACPNQKYVLGGHSQGGVVTVRAIKQMDKNLLPKIIAVTMVGSPECPAEVKDRCKSFCNQGDPICTPSGSTGASLTEKCDRVPEGGSPALAASPKMPKAAGFPKLVPKPEPKGGMGDMAGMDMDKRKRSVSTAQGAWTSDKAMHEWMQRMTTDVSMCAGPEVPEKGHKAIAGEGPHMMYNKDGYYIRAAACYILKQFKASGGA